MFKRNDDVICINNNNGKFPITIGKSYKVLYFKKHENMIVITCDDKSQQQYLTERFTTLLEYRKQKIEKIKDRICLEKVN